jgi:hypothetical protein
MTYAGSDIAEAFSDLRASLEWGATLDLTEDQRKSLAGLCCQIGGCVPRWRLNESQEAKRKAEARVKELEAALRGRREEWVFRRKRTSNPPLNGPRHWQR